MASSFSSRTPRTAAEAARSATSAEAELVVDRVGRYDQRVDLTETIAVELRSICARLHRESNAWLVLLVYDQAIVMCEPAKQLAVGGGGSLGAATTKVFERFVVAEIQRCGWDDLPTESCTADGLSVHIAHVLGQFALAVVFDDNTSLGLVRMRARLGAAHMGKTLQLARM